MAFEVNVELSSVQIGEVPVILAVGSELTVMSILSVAVNPFPSVTVTS